MTFSKHPRRKTAKVAFYLVHVIRRLVVIRIILTMMMYDDDSDNEDSDDVKEVLN